MGVLYYDAPAWMFTAAYTVLALAVALLYSYMPPLPQPSRARPSWLLRTIRQDDQGISGSDALSTRQDQERVQVQLADLAFALYPKL